MNHKSFIRFKNFQDRHLPGLQVDRIDSFSDQAGELRTYFDGTNTIVEANVNGDAAADFQILVNGKVTLSAVDFLL